MKQNSETSSRMVPIEAQIQLNKFVPRPYQIPIFEAIENRGIKRVIAIMPRRAGKDVMAFNLCIRQCLKKICVIYYVFPSYSQGRKIIMDSVLNSGERFIDFIPKELIDSVNSQEMKIKFINGSLLQVVGSDNIDSLVGTNPYGVVFSEYALQDPRAYQFIRPILTANGGWALFITTPRGKNHAWELFQIAQNSPHWFATRLTLDDTQHIPYSEIEKERAEGIMSEDLIQQEYMCSFDMGVEGAYYAKYLDKARVEGRIGDVPWEPGFKTHVSIDIGVRDSTSIIWFQQIGSIVRIIDYYENSKEGLEHYVKVLQNKPYVYGKYIAPFDIQVKEWGSGITRLEKARQLGINFTIAPDAGLMDGIESVRSKLGIMYIDQTKCALLLKALENYRQEYDPKHKVYKSIPLHNWASHACFSGDTLVLTRNGMRQIMLIEQNDEILTLEGWKACSRAFMTRKNAELVEVSFSDGTKVKCTPDHLFLTESGWKSAKRLKMDTVIQSSLISSTNILWDSYTAYGQTKDIPLVEEKNFTDRCGSMPSEIFPQIATYITKIMTLLTIIYGTLSALIQESTLRLLGLMARGFRRSLALGQPSGMGLTQAGYGISSTLTRSNRGQYGQGSQWNASYVSQTLKELFVKMVSSKSSAIQIAKPLTIVGVKKLNEKQDLWCINVPDTGHFSLSNGAVVRNCDALRYLCISLPKIRDGGSPQELDARYREAVMGEQSSLPPIFRR